MRIDPAESAAQGRLREHAAKALKRAVWRAGLPPWHGWKREPNRLLVWVQWARICGVGVEEVVFRLLERHKREAEEAGRDFGVRMETLSGPSAYAWVLDQVRGATSGPREGRMHRGRRDWSDAAVRRARAGR